MINFPERRRVYLMRHGEAAYVSPEGVVTTDPDNVPLTPHGREQATTHGEVLANIKFDRAVCSGLPRTVETAGIVTAANNHTTPELEVIPDLREIHGMKGDRQWPPADGRTTLEALEEIANPWATGAQPGAKFLGGESFEDFAARVAPSWDRLMVDDNWQTLLLVLHGGVNRMILNHLTGLPWRGDLCFEQDNCNINIIDVDSTAPLRYLIRAVNMTAYNLSKDGIVFTNMEATAKRIGDTLSAENQQP